MIRTRLSSRQPLLMRMLLATSAALAPIAMAADKITGDGNPSLFTFRDTGEDAGVSPHVKGIHGHGAGWGDVDGDGWMDLYVGTFPYEGPGNMLLRNKQGSFQRDDQSSLQLPTRATGVVFADLDNDDDLDLYVGSMPAPADSKLAERLGKAVAGCSLFRNDGAGKFTNISDGNGACPAAFGGRSATVLDYDGDGLLDLLVGEDPIPGYNGSQTKSSRLFRNLGNLKFQDVSRSVGLPEETPGLGVAVADVNNDGWPDFFLAANGGGNRLFLNNGQGKFSEAAGSRDVFDWPTAGGDNMVCGVCFGDVNRDGLLDIVLGQHFKQPWQEPVANRLYVNRGLKNGVPRFEDVTEQVGLVPLPMKAPHVELQDFDNDGWPDLYTSLVKFADGQPHPVIFKNQGIRQGLPRFQQSALAVNDFPTAEDKGIRRSGDMFDKVLREGKVIYMAPGPSGDYDNDGRLDLFLPNWWAESPSLLLHNETPGGNWLQVQVSGPQGVNRMGLGSRVNVYLPGRVGDRAAYLGCREIATGYGYASGQPAMAHFGLGAEEMVDLEIVLPHGKGRFVRKDVAANQRLTVSNE